MEEDTFRSWDDFNKNEYRRCGTFQLSLEDLARDVYYDDGSKRQKEEEEELNFDY